MKKLLFTLLAAGLIMQGCEEKRHEPDTGKRYTVSFSLTNAETRLTGNTDENAINKALFIIFDEAGEYVTSIRPEGTSAETELYGGDYTVAAIVNTGYDIPESGCSLASVRKSSIPLEANSKNNLVMYGEKDFTLEKSGNDIAVEIKRNVSKISLENIINDMADPVFRTMNLEIRRIFVSNVSGVSYLAGGNAPSIWYNMNGEWNGEPEIIKAMLCDSDINHLIPYKNGYRQEYYYYVYPNDTPGDSYEYAWCPRFTRLVVEASLNGETCYYPITFGEIKANHTYKIENLTITKPGTKHPWEKTEGETCGFTVSVCDWEEGSNMDETI